MLILVVGLIIFFSLHSVRLVAPQWSDKSMARHGAFRWRLRFGMITLLAAAFIIMGYMQLRLAPVWVWFPPVWARHLAALLMLVALFFVGCSLVPNTTFKKKLGYPMLIAIKIWAFSHLISNGALADIILFGSFLVWSIVAFAVYRRRDRKAGVVRDNETGVHFDLAAFTFAMVSWFAIVFYLHQALIGVSPLV